MTGAGAMNFPGFTGPPPEAPSALGDPPISAAERAAVAEALHLADLWLEPASALPSGIRTAQAWSRAEWVTQTLPIWRKLCDPVAGRMVGAMGDLVPEEMRGQRLVRINANGLYLEIQTGGAAELFFEERDLFLIEVRCDWERQCQ